MFTTIGMRKGALVLLMVGAVAGAAEAQTTPRTCSVAGGPFTLTNGKASFHLALDDDSSEPGVIVLMRFINQRGTVVKSETVSIAAGGSATLEYRGNGLFRAQAEIFDIPSNFWSTRRIVIGSVELVQNLVLPEADRPVGPGPWIKWCAEYDDRD